MNSSCNIKVLYISNYLNFHQTIFFDEFIKYIPNFTFLSTTYSPCSIKPLESRDYCMLAKNISNEEIDNFLSNYDAIIIGACNDKRFIKHIPANALIFHNSEHYWKKYNTPISLAKRILRMIELKRRYKKVQNLYLLANSSFLSGEFRKFNISFKKSYKFGYYPPVSFDEMNPKRNNFDIVYVGRIIKYKNTDHSLFCLKTLKTFDSRYSLTFYGEGKYLKTLKKKAPKDVIFNGFVNHSKVLEIFKNSSIFCFSSSKEEGWGAVLNEALSCGCIVFANIMAGSTRFLIKDKINGFTYRNLDELKEKLIYFSKLSNEEALSIRRNAVETISNLWNEKIASERFANLICDIFNGTDEIHYSEGPCSLDL